MRGGALAFASDSSFMALAPLCEQPSQKPVSTSAKIVNVGNSFRSRREIEGVEAVAICREAIRLAFPGASVEAIAQASCGPLLASPATIRRILDGTTSRFDGGIGFRALAFAAVSPRIGQSRLLPLFHRFAAAVAASQEAGE